MTSNCPECGCPINATEKTCPECGHPITNIDSKSQISNSTSNLTTPIIETPDTYSNNSFWKNKNNIIYLSLGFVATIAIAIAIYFGLTNSKSNIPENNTVDSDTAISIETSKPIESSNRYVLAERMWFRSSPEISKYNQIDLLYYGALIDVISYEGNWAYVKVNGTKGYVNRDFIVGEHDFIRFNSLISKISRGDMMAAARQALISYSEKEGRVGSYDSRVTDIFPDESNSLQCMGFKEFTFDTGETVVVLKIMRTDTSKRWLTAYKLYPSGSFDYISDYNWISNPSVYKQGNNYYIQ